MARDAKESGGKPEPAAGAGAAPRPAPQDPRLRGLIGGLGGITPFVVAIVVSDAATIDAYLSAIFDPQQRAVLHLVGYLVKVPIFFLIGVLWAKLHNPERNLLKIYQLGIVAPAIITGTIAASRIQSTIDKTPAPVVSIPSVSSKGKQDGSVRITEQNQVGSVLSIQYVKDKLRQANPEGVVATPVIRRSVSLTISDIFRDLRNGFLDRPPDRILACSNLPVLAYVPNASKAVILESGSSCQILIDPSNSSDEFSTAACRDFNATLLSSRLSASVSDRNGICVFRLSAR